jgi:hypothetical protein
MERGACGPELASPVIERNHRHEQTALCPEANSVDSHPRDPRRIESGTGRSPARASGCSPQAETWRLLSLREQ